MSVSKNYQKALEICDEFQEFQIIEYIKGKSPKLKLKCLKCGHEFERYQCHFIQYPHVCPKCHPKGSNQYITLEEAQKRVDDVYGKEYLGLLEYRGNNELINVQCKKCSQIFQSIPANLWRGRFFIRQYESRFFRYEDGSGNQLLCVLRFYDHKTQKYMDMCASSNQIFIHGGWETWNAMNNFIVRRLNVWKNEDPRADKTDYRTFSKEETIKNSTPLVPY